VLRDTNISCIRKEVEYWVRISKKPQWELHKKWSECEKGWENINWEMKGIDLPKFVSFEDFVNLHDIVKRHAKKDSAWQLEIIKVESMEPGQIKQFIEHPIKAHAIP
jgi:hypothetical protein